MNVKLYFCIIIGGGLFLSFQFPFSKTEEGLVAHYTFNKCDARDISENNPDGQVYGDPGCHCGVEGNALFFDGINDYVEFSGVVNRYFNTQDFTVSFYIKPNKYSIFKQSLLSKRDSCNENHMLDFQLDINKREIKTDLFEAPYKYFKEISPETPQTDWIHFALVRRGIRAYTYINGELRREGRRCSGVDIGNEALLSFSNTPCLTTGRTVRFKGGLDELRVYDHALTDEEIMKIYSLNPVETAEVDCVTFIPKLNSEKTQSAYLCVN
ncbi:MAG: LamG domain-containing protein [Bacteroidota bacterium]